MENFESAQQFENPLTITKEIKDYLLETAKWGKFLAIVGFVGMGLLLLMGVILVIGFSTFNSVPGVILPFRVMGFIYITIAIIYYFPIRYLFNYSVLLKNGFTSANQQEITSGFENLKSIFRFMGIFTIIVLALYALIIIVAVPLAIFSYMH